MYKNVENAHTGYVYQEVQNMKDISVLTFGLGLICGAYIVTKSNKAKEMVEQGAKNLKKKMKKITK